MNIRRIIEQEVDKQEWGLELPNQVKLGDETLELTDRGVYQGDNTEVEYKVEDDKVLTSDDEELIPVQESEFDWIDYAPNTINSEGDIGHFLRNDMYNINPLTGKPRSEDEGKVVDLTYWIEPNGEEPEAYNVCWYEHITDNITSKVCTRFRSKTIVNMFKIGEFVFIDNYER
jgi:hypothetical protein